MTILTCRVKGANASKIMILLFSFELKEKVLEKNKNSGKAQGKLKFKIVVNPVLTNWIYSAWVGLEIEIDVTEVVSQLVCKPNTRKNDPKNLWSLEDLNYVIAYLSRYDDLV